MQLVPPTITYKDSFLEALQEYHVAGDVDLLDVYDLSVKRLQMDFGKYVKQTLAEVPQTTYWLIDGDAFIGRVSIRHTLTDSLLKFGGHIGYDIRPSKRQMGYGKKLLALALPKAKELGITKILITCDETNLASKKIIEANGGIFENSLPTESKKPNKLRYWIT